jgi:HlyD family secretion protein
VKKPWLKRAGIAILLVVVTVCGGAFAVIGDGAALFSERRQIGAIATPLPDAGQGTDSRLGAAPVATTLARAERQSITETLAVTGTLVAREEIVVGTEVDGLRIIEILADVGDRVEQGQVLARLDRAMLQTQLAQNTSTIEKAEATIGQVKASIAEMQAAEAEAAAALQRTQKLRATGTASLEQLLAREAQAKVAAAKAVAAEQHLSIAKAEKALADAQHREIELKIERTELKALAAGTISHRAARLGAVAGIGGEPLFRLVRNSEIEFDAEVLETALPRIEPGQNVELWLAGVSDAIGGHVRLVDPTVDKMSRLGRVAIALAPHPAMRAGIFARGTITLGARQAITVPLSAVLFGKNGAYVQLVTDNIVEIRNVETGFKRGGRIEIVKGLIEGQEVVVRAAAFLRPGERIMPVRNDTRAAGAG